MALKDKLIAKLSGVLTNLVEKYLNQIKKPSGLDALQLSAGVLMSTAMSEIQKLIETAVKDPNSSDEYAKKAFDSINDGAETFDSAASKYVKTNPTLRKLTASIDQDFQFSAASDITLVCGDPDLNTKMLQELMQNLAIPENSLMSEDLINVIGNKSSFDEKISSSSINTILQSDLFKTFTSITPWLFLLYDVFRKAKEWLSQNDFPSKFFAKFLQNRIRLIASAMRNFMNDSIDEYTQKETNIINSTKGLIDSLKLLDIAIEATVIAFAIYEDNLKTLGDRARQWLKDYLSKNTCDSTLEDPSTGNTALIETPVGLQGIQPLDLTGFDIAADKAGCPLKNDNVPSPNMPISNPTDEDVICQIITSDPSPGLPVPVAPLPSISTTAIYSYMGVQTWVPNPKPGELVGPEDIVFTIRDSKSPSKQRTIRSSVIGTVTKIDKQKKLIVLENIQTPMERPLEDDIKSINSLYQELSNTEVFLKDWNIRSWYPVMLMKSPYIDSSLAQSENLKINYIGSVESRWIEARQRQSGKKYDGTGGIDNAYDKDIKDLTDKDTIKQHAENQTTNVLKTQIDKRKATYYKSLENIGIRAINQAKTTTGEQGEEALYDYYFELYEALLAAKDLSQGLEYEINTPPEDKVDNPLLSGFTKKISEFLWKRAFIEGYSSDVLANKIESISKDLDKEVYFKKKGIKYDPASHTGGYFWTLFDQYEYDVNQQKSGKKALKVTSSKLEQWGKGNNTLSDDEKTSLRWRILKLFELYVTIADKRKEEYKTEETPKEAVDREGSYIESFFNTLWVNLQEIPKEIERISAKLDEQSNSYVPSAEGEYNGKPATYYYVADSQPDSCPLAKEGENNNLNKINYWVKYCSFATLASVFSGPPNWGTGFITPLGPLPLPTIYIPIKGFQLPWGIALLGLTITGIYPFPFVMIANLSSNHVVPFLDPASFIRREAETLKLELSEQLDNLKLTLLTPAFTKAKDRVDEYDVQLDDIDIEIAEHKVAKPKRDRAAESISKKEKAIALGKYAKQLELWEEKRLELTERKTGLVVGRFGAALKAKILSDWLNDIKDTKGVQDPLIKTVETTQAAIDKAFEVLEGVINKIDLFLSPLPIAAKPNSTNFVFTLKNPKPLSKIDDGFDDVVKTDVLAPYLNKIDYNKDELTNSSFSSVMAIKYKAADTVMDIMNGPLKKLIIPKEPFPTYSNLKASNLSWTTGYLLPKWAPTGGKQYGIPGFPKY